MHTQGASAKMHVVDIQHKKMGNIGNVDAHMRNVYLLKCS
jgi:hypothetical protein